MSFEIGQIVVFEGMIYKIVCNGDVRGTFDLHPLDKGDIWRNVPPTMIQPYN